MVQLPRNLRYRLQRSDTAGPVLLAVLVGVLAAAWAIAFRWLIRGAQWVFLDRDGFLAALFPGDGVWSELQILLAPAIGLVIVVLVVQRWAPEARGLSSSVRWRGVPSACHTDRCRGRTGRSPSGQSAASGHPPATRSARDARQEGGPLLAACGAAAGIGATFNGPIAGVLFALEVILGSFAARSFGLVVISSVAATALSRSVLGPEPAFRLLDRFSLVSLGEFPLYLLLGTLLGLLAALYVKSIDRFEIAFERWRRPLTLKAATGGLAVGAMGLFGSTLIFGVGYEGVDLALAGELTVGLMLLLVFLKMLATSLTLAAGGSGGVFAPALFIGAMAGGAFGLMVNGAFPEWTAPSGAYALVGMAALFGAAAHAPITAILILFEMTDDYQIILPLMLAVVVSHLTKSRVLADSIYSIKLARLGGMEGPRREVSVLDLLLVVDAMRENFDTVSPDLPLDKLAEMARIRRTRSWPVVDSAGELVGIVAGTDLELALVSGDERPSTVGDIMSTSVVTLRPSDTLREAFRRFAERDIQLIPVVEDPDGLRLAGVLRRHEMVWAYKTVSDEHQQLLDTVRGKRPGELEDVIQIDVGVGRNERRLANLLLRDIRLPPEVLVTLVRREGRLFVPQGKTRVRAGDVLLLMTTSEHESELRDWISEGSAGR
jgi:CIC family chloride channel protein